ncbi:MAG: hypothetical protein OEY96_06305 [Gammaproteobacteria bacterium]|nr:hypothetical protein [Gammaproteobacteria bacterium]
MKKINIQTWLNIILILGISYYVYQNESDRIVTTPESLSDNVHNFEDDVEIKIIDSQNNLEAGEIDNKFGFTWRMNVNYTYNGYLGKAHAVIRPHFTTENNFIDDEKKYTYIPLRVGTFKKPFDIQNPCGTKNYCEADYIDIVYIPSKKFKYYYNNGFEPAFENQEYFKIRLNKPLIFDPELRIMAEKNRYKIDAQNDFEILSIKDTSNTIVAKFTYNGEYGQQAKLLIKPHYSDEKLIEKDINVITATFAFVGTHKQTISMRNPCDHSIRCEADYIEVLMMPVSKFKTHLVNEYFDNNEYFKKKFNNKIIWKPLNTIENKILTVEDAAHRIDNRQLKSAKSILDSILSKNPDDVDAYIELSRYYIIKNSNSSGYNKALEVLNLALDINNDDANIYILRGHVYTLKGLFNKAKIDFDKAEQLGTDNLWLYVNLADMYLKQEKLNQSEALLRKVVEHDRFYDRRDRPITAAYDRLIMNAENNKDFVIADKLYDEKITKFKENQCYLSRWAEFKLRLVGDVNEANQLAQSGFEGCGNKTSVKRIYADTLIARSTYKKLSKEERDDSYKRGVILDLDWSKRIYRFSQYPKLNKILGELVVDRVDIDVIDDQGKNALIYAIEDNNLKSILNLIQLGADPNKQTDDEFDGTVFLWALFVAEEETVSVIMDSTNNLKTEFKNGLTAQMVAKERGFDKIVDKLNNTRRL